VLAISGISVGRPSACLIATSKAVQRTDAHQAIWKVCEEKCFIRDFLIQGF